MPKKIEIEKKTCENCGKVYPSYSLEVHHKDGNHKNNDLNNLVVWCNPCHRAFHLGGKTTDHEITELSPPKLHIQKSLKEVV